MAKMCKEWHRKGISRGRNSHAMLWMFAIKLAQSLAWETTVVQAGLKGSDGSAIAAFKFGTSQPLTVMLENKWYDSSEVLKNKAVTSYLINFKCVVCSYVCKAKCLSTGKIFSTKFCVQIYWIFLLKMIVIVEINLQTTLFTLACFQRKKN